MKNKQQNNPRNNRQQDRELTLNYIVKQVETGTEKSLVELKHEYSEDQLFWLSLQHVTTTKKALCKAIDIPVEAACRYKRRYELQGVLVQSTTEVICPFTGHPAHNITTNPDEFEALLSTNQLKLF